MTKPERPPLSAADFHTAKLIYEARLQLKRAAIERVEKRAAKRAQRAAELGKLRMVQSLLEAAEVMRLDGATIAEARERLLAKLKPKVLGGPHDPYLDLAVGNHLQTAYNSGKVQEFLEPETLELRPYWLYDAIMDMKTSRICRSCNGIIRPAGDAWFMHRIPPCHHRCRSTIRAITPAQMERYGGVESKPPRVPAEDGFGRLAEVEWKPNLKGVNPDLVKVYRSRA